MVEDTASETRLDKVLRGAETHNCTCFVRALGREKFLAATGWFVSFEVRLLWARKVAYRTTCSPVRLDWQLTAKTYSCARLHV